MSFRGFISALVAMIAVSIVIPGPCMARGGRLAARVPTISPDRTLYIVGEIGGREPFMIADAIVKAAEMPGDIYLIINSPGGSVTAGTFILSAMEYAHAKGRRFVCVVPGLAASMAFQIFAYCDDRYAFPNAYLLWHPVRAGADRPLTPVDARRLSRDLDRIEATLVEDLRLRMKLDDETFYEHYYAETLFRATELRKLLPSYYILVNAAPLVKSLIPFRPQLGPFDRSEIYWTISPSKFYLIQN